jgi:hypothetical protein
VEKVIGRRMRPTATRETLGVSRGRRSGQRPRRSLSTGSYQIGKHEVPISQYTALLNAVAASDP